MCIVILSTAHPDYSLILLSNRDEFLNRPTAHADFWSLPNEHVLGGRDLERKEQGTWLAITRQGRLTALTNFREEGAEKAKDKSRGGIVNAYLTSSPDRDESPQDFARRLIEDFGVHDVGGFSMLFGQLRAPDKDGNFPGFSILSNRSASADALTKIAVSPGETHALSNSHFGDMSWPKVVHGEQLLRQAIDSNIRYGSDTDQDHLLERLFDILSVDTLPKRKQGEDWDTYVRQMRNSILIPPTSGPSVESQTASQVASAKVSSANGTATPDYPPQPSLEGQAVPNGAYGTQKQTVILVGKDGKVLFAERTLYDNDGKRLSGSDGERRFSFEIEGWHR